MITKEILKPSLQPKAPEPVIPNLQETWSKLRYAYWIESVKLRFKKGDWVVFKDKRSKLDYEILDIQEMHLFAKIDATRNIPKAILLGRKDCFPFWVTPDEIELLTADNAYISDTKVEFPEREKYPQSLYSGE